MQLKCISLCILICSLALQGKRTKIKLALQIDGATFFVEFVLLMLLLLLTPFLAHWLTNWSGMRHGEQGVRGNCNVLWQRLSPARVLCKLNCCNLQPNSRRRQSGSASHTHITSHTHTHTYVYLMSESEKAKRVACGRSVYTPQNRRQI